MGVKDNFYKKAKDNKTQNGGVANRFYNNNNPQGNTTWFQKGTYEDGYKFGDLNVGIGGTVVDILGNVAQGVGNFGEGVADLGLYLGGGLADLFGFDSFAEENKKKAQKNTVSDFFDKYINPTTDKDSFLGEKSDTLAQGVGYVLPSVGVSLVAPYLQIGAIGTSALTTGGTFASSMGSGMSEAYNAGATDSEAWKYGFSSGLIEAGTELFWGGLGGSARTLGLTSGIGGLDDILANKLTAGLKSRVAKTLAKAGIKATGEGLEEVAAGFLSAIAKHHTYATEKEFDELVKDENLLESFIGGAFVGGVFQVGNVAKSFKTGRDIITGFTSREEAVVDALYNETVNNAKAKGQKLTKSDLAKIREQSEEAVRSGEVSVELIEKTLGGDAQKGLDALSAEADEFDKLYKTPGGELSREQQNRLNELEAKNKERSFEERKKEARQGLRQSVLDASAKDQYIGRAYVEEGKRYKAYSVNAKEYSGKGRAVVENAMKAGFLNDSSITHRFVDLVAKLATEKGIEFDFTSNEKLKNSGFALGGRVINGFESGGKITVNMNAAKALNSVVGHEITHVLKGTAFYNDLKTALFRYAQGKKEYDGRRKVLEELYKDVKGADVNEELMADLVGDYLFTDEAFIRRLSTENKNLFEKIFDEIKYLARLATAGSKEARELERVKRLFEKVYKEADARKAEGTRLSVSDGIEIEVVDGYAVAPNVATAMKSDEYAKPDDYMTKYSVSSTPDWEKSYIERHHDNKDYMIVEAIKTFTDKMVQDDAVRGYVPMGDYKYSKMGPLRSNVEYVVTFDMDTSCPRTFQFLNFRDAIQRKAGRYLTYNESINLLELMRAYGQQIPCCYCYVENKRVLLSASYNNFFGFRDAVMKAKTNEEAAKVMYGYSEKKGLPDASRKALERWRSDLSYNPSITEVWTATNTARNSVLNYLDAQMESGNIDEKTAESKLNKMILDQFGIKDKGAIVEIESFVKDWAYDTLAKIPHVYNTDNDTSVSAVDERALALNHEALAYSKSASSAKSVENYVPYTDQLKNVSKEDREYIMGMGGIRKHSSNDFRMDYVQDYFLFYADLAADKWTGHTYTKSADFTKIFACTNDRINMSVAFYEDADGTLRENIDEGAAWKDVKELRKAYKNVGAMAMVTSDAQLSYALNSDWIDMIIPFHASGLDKAVWYNLRMWNDYTSKQGERFYNADTMKQKLSERGIAVPKGANAAQIKALFEETFQIKHIYGEKGDIVKPHFFPGDTYVNGQLVPGHHNDVETYFRLCEEYGVHPRFYGIKVNDTNGNQIDVTEHPSYLKLIKETSRTDSAQEEIQFNFGNYDAYLKMTPFEYAMKRLQEEAKNGGFENTKVDPYGVVDEFINEYLDKDRPLGYLTERAKETREILLETSNKNIAKQADIVEKEVNAFSLSKENASAPIAPLPGYNVRGEDIALKTAPLAKNTDGVTNTKAAANGSAGGKNQPTGGEKYTVNDSPRRIIPNETRVVAKDRGNIGTVKGYNPETKEYTVFFKSKDGATATVVLAADQIREAGRNGTKGMEINELRDEITNLRARLDEVKAQRDEKISGYQQIIDTKQALYDSKANKDTKVASNLMASIEHNTKLRDNAAAKYDEQIRKLESELQDDVDQLMNEEETARLTHEPVTSEEKQRSFWSYVKELLFDKGMVFETLGKKHHNRFLESLWNQTRLAEPMAQHFIQNGVEGYDSINEVRKKLNAAGTSDDFEAYMYHLHNSDRMRLGERAKVKAEDMKASDELLAQLTQIEGAKYADARALIEATREAVSMRPSDISTKTKELWKKYKEYSALLEINDKPVFGKTVTAEISDAEAARLLSEHPEFKEYAEAIYANTKALRQMLVDSGIISQDAANMWDEMYPHYVPIKRDKAKKGAAVSVPLDSRRTGVNVPVKKATGGNSDIGYLFSTLAERTEQTFSAVARNEFGKELRKVLALEGMTDIPGVLPEGQTGEGLDSVANLADIEKTEGGEYAFTVFEGGKRRTFEVTEEMYDALKPRNKFFSTKIPLLGKISTWQRNVLTQYNPVFWMTNFIKDAQDVVWNSQHAGATYKTMMALMADAVATKGKKYFAGDAVKKYQSYIDEYAEHGGEGVTYFDRSTKAYVDEVSDLGHKALNTIVSINEAVERLPRLAEYIASREAGRSIEESMLDASRVTTNFQAGGDLTKWLNKNGFTFLNASVQGAVQSIRNVREAYMEGAVKGTIVLAAKLAALGLPALILNALKWKDDEDYEQLSDYVKDNYYVISKNDDGTFVRIPKGRMAAVIGDLFEQVANGISGEGADFGNTAQLAISNLAPNNPIENNVLAPLIQAYGNKTWYGEDLIPSRLQNLPREEQYDESTDTISVLLGRSFVGKVLNLSPYQINYLLNQYSGGIGDFAIPMFTPEVESRSNWAIAPFVDKFTTNANFNSQYVSDFYDTMDELTKAAQSMNATDEDQLRYKYFLSQNSKLSELYKQKREVQAVPSKELSDKEKYNAVYDIQEQINKITKQALDSYENVVIDKKYATVGDVGYYWYEPSEDAESAEPGWHKISDDQLTKQNKVCSEFDISPAEYWNNREELNYAYDYPARYIVSQFSGGYETYRDHMKVINKIESDKDENDETISGSRKKKVLAYILSAKDLDANEKMILYRSLYSDSQYNRAIVDYLAKRSNVSYENKLKLLEALGFKVGANGVYW